ncbi:MAG TPA: lipoyl(octanoyl) transferase LipB [Polyangiaceae bacterium]|nr:lipoyl(octanoyl) transferase LipB [Polyangiaceae bacterium]
MTTRELRGIYLGRRRYAEVLELQERLVSARLEGRVPDTVLLLEHEPVITLGKSAKRENVLFTEEFLRERGVDLVPVGRGGDVTLHAPGQLVGYPIVDLSPDRCDVRRYVKDLTFTMSDVALRHGVSAGEMAGNIGLWADRARPSEFPGKDAATELVKIGAVGVRISRWITMHGFALNLSVPVELFQLIVPCGIRDHAVSSVEELTGAAPTVHEAAVEAFDALCRRFGADGALSDWSGRPLPVDADSASAEVRAAAG